MTIDYLASVKHLLATVDSNDLETYVNFFSDDAVYKIGNAEPVIGQEGIREFVMPIMQIVKSVAHDIKNIWKFENTVICEADVTYNRQDGKVFTLPNVNIIRFKGDKIQKYQAFIDTSPVFS